MHVQINFTTLTTKDKELWRDNVEFPPKIITRDVPVKFRYPVESGTILQDIYSTHTSVCNRSQMMSQCVKNRKVRHETKSSGVTVVLYTL